MKSARGGGEGGPGWLGAAGWIFGFWLAGPPPRGSKTLKRTSAEVPFLSHGEQLPIYIYQTLCSENLNVGCQSCWGANKWDGRAGVGARELRAPRRQGPSEGRPASDKPLVGSSKKSTRPGTLGRSMPGMRKGGNSEEINQYPQIWVWFPQF